MSFNFNNNPLMLTDSYKVTHACQYPPNTSKIYSYLESRGGEYAGTTFFGLQYFLKNYLEGVRITQEDIDQAFDFFAKHFNNPELFNRAGWEHIVKNHDGKLPVSIKAVPEGTTVPTKNVLMTIENTDPNCYWLTNYLETLLVQVWYPTTTATISREMKKILLSSLEETSDDPSAAIGFMLHDFGFRGVSSVESAATGGAGHLLNFLGGDTLAACVLAKEFYGSEMAGFSIPAAEHSTITSWGKDGEFEACENMLDQFPQGLVAIVIDSWDPRNCVKNIIGRKLRDKIMSRTGEPVGRVVVRPDSGDPEVVVPDILDILGNEFSDHTFRNDKGFKVLPDQVRVIQGDGINRNSIQGILNVVRDRGWSTENLAFGSGGGLLQQCDRDTQKFAFKCSHWEDSDGNSRDVYKQPATDPGKNSKRGRLKLVKDDSFITVTGTPWATVVEDKFPDFEDQLVEVFRDGEVLVNQNFDQIRERAAL